MAQIQIDAANVPYRLLQAL